MTDQQQQAARELHAQGLGYTRIAKRLGMAPTTVRRIISPEYAEYMRRLSREAKRRRTGTCGRCGSQTQYAGGHDKSVSDLCASCNIEDFRERTIARRGTGSVGAKVLSFIGDGERGYMEIVTHIGVTKNHANVLLHRLVGYGLLVRPARGRYRRAA